MIEPDKPFYMYFAPQAGHAPHQVPLEWADKYKGVFDQGYEAIRVGILERQIELGLFPEDTELSTINPHGEPERTSPDGKPWPALDTVRPWDTLNADERRLFVRMAEIFAGYISYWDDRFGQILDYLEESGQLDNTIIVVDVRQRGERRRAARTASSTSGGSSTACRVIPSRRSNASTSSARRSRTTTTTPDGRGRSTRRSRTGNAGPARRAVSPTCVSVSWPAQIAADPTPRQHYIHAVDVVPTIYELLGIEPPDVIKGYLQSPIEGESFAKALTDATVPGRETQFYTMLGQRSIYHQGWLACTVHPPLSGWGAFDKDEWELFHLETDRAQTKNIAADDPQRLETLKQLWFYYAGMAMDPIRAEFPDRIFDPPTSEAAIVSIGAGAAMAGARPFVDIGTASFSYVGWSPLVNEAAVACHMSDGAIRVPVVYHMLHGLRGGGAAQHSHSPQAMLWNAAGLEIVPAVQPL